MSRQPIVSANWKANQGGPSDRERLDEFALQLTDVAQVEVSIHPPFTALMPTRGRTGFFLGAQDCSTELDGAHTGEITAAMLDAFGVKHVIVGHSERRADHGDTAPIVALKLRRALEAGLSVILCCGETREARERGEAEVVVGGQVAAALEGPSVSPERIVVAYEPVWAIGAGVAATPEEAQSMCAFVRKALAGTSLGAAGADATRVQYGGSVTAENVAAFAACPDVDGVLVGGASRTPDTFVPLVRAFV